MARQLDALQILRGLAASLVVFDHLVSATLHRMGRQDVDLSGLWFAGALGVKVFFCISGYIIAHSLLTAGSGRQSMYRFYLRRLIRVVPLYWLATLLFSLSRWSKGSPPGGDELIRSLLFIPYADDQGQMRPVLGLGWSLNFEMFFYLVLGQSLWFRSRWAPAVVVSLVLVPIWCLSLWLSPERLQQALPGGLGLLVSPVLGYFLSGVALAYLSPIVERRQWFPWPGVGAVSAALALAISGLVAAVLARPSLLSRADDAAVALAILSVLWCTLQDGSPSRPSRTIVWAKQFGDASYSTYLSHSLLVGSAAALLVGLPGWSNLPNAAILILCVLPLPLFNAFGWAVHRRIELPLMALCTARLLPRPPQAARVR